MNIIPGKCIGSYKLGEQGYEQKIRNLDLIAIESQGRFSVYKTKEIWFFLDEKDNNALNQMTVFYPFQGKVMGKVGIADSLENIKENFGFCTIEHGVYEPIEYPGVSFELEGHGSEKIYCISVSIPYKFYGELPEHIQKNLQSTKKLP